MKTVCSWICPPLTKKVSVPQASNPGASPPSSGHSHWTNPYSWLSDEELGDLEAERERHARYLEMAKAMRHRL